MKNLTLITTRFPWPLTNGFANKNYWLIKGLSDGYAIDLHVIQRAPVPKGDLDRIRGYCKSVNVYRPSLLNIAYGFFRALIKNEPIQFSLFYSSKAMRAISLDIRTTDVALFSVIRSAQYLPNNFFGPVVFDLADSLGQIYVRDATNFSFMKRLVYVEEGRRMIMYEKSIVKRANQIFFFNPNEAATYKSPKVAVVPHGVDSQLFDIENVDLRCSDGVVIFGKMNFEPNIQAVLWFFNNVLNRLPSHIKLYVIGAEPSGHLLRLARLNQRVEILGFIENPYPLIKGAIANISPIQMGGGIQNKVIEGLAIGALGLVSPLAAVPMKSIEASGLIICRTPEEWVSAIVQASVNPRFYDRNRLMGREYAKAHFSWEAYCKEVKAGIAGALEPVSFGGNSNG